ncbi:DegT/DnrJ/EryC1/StrS family aminotransferase [soil metagenome]
MLISPNETAIRPPASERSLPVPVMDLRRQYEAIGEEIVSAVTEVLENQSYILGPAVGKFETSFAHFCRARHCIAVNSGTSALHLALICAGVGASDEVITVPMTFIATSWAISYCGATPVFVDVDPQTFTMNPQQVEARITPRTRAILPVHLYGQPADLEPLRAIAHRHGIALIEDCAQSHGSSYNGVTSGTIGLAGCFSFYPGKNLGACGEAGAIVTNDDAIAARMRALRDHAQEQRYHHDEIGFNYRMDGVQGAVLNVKLKHLDRWTAQRRALADRYLRLLDGLPLELPVEAGGRHHVWHQFVVRHPQRDLVRAKLLARGIQTALHYPIPLHLQKAYLHLGYAPGDFPVAEQIARDCITLPMYPELSHEQQDAVVDALTEVLSEVSA